MWPEKALNVLLLALHYRSFCSGLNEWTAPGAETVRERARVPTDFHETMLRGTVLSSGGYVMAACKTGA